MPQIRARYRTVHRYLRCDSLIMGLNFDSDFLDARKCLRHRFHAEEKADWLEIWAPAVLERLSRRG